MANNSLPPISLIKTWVWMMTESEEDDVRQRGMDNLVSAFGSLKSAQEYLLKQSQKENA